MLRRHIRMVRGALECDSNPSCITTGLRSRDRARRAMRLYQAGLDRWTERGRARVLRVLPERNFSVRIILDLFGVGSLLNW